MSSVTTLGQLVADGRLILNDGYRTKQAELGEPGMPILRVAEVLDGSIAPALGDYVREEYRRVIGSKMSRPGDVIVTTKGTVGRVAIIRQSMAEFVYSPQLCFFRPTPASGIDSGFLYQWFRGREFQHQALSVQSQTDMAPYINLSDLRRMTITLPSRSEQRAIADTLGALDDKIESNHRMAKTLDALVATTYEQAIAGCALAPMGTAIIVSTGSAFSGAHFSKPGIGRPLLRIRDLKTYKSQTWTTEARRDEIVIQPGDVVAGMDAEFRATVWLGSSSLLNQRVCRFSPRRGVSRAFALHSARRDLASAEASKTGTTVIHLNKSDIDRFAVPALDDTAHDRLARSTDYLLDTLVAAAQESRTVAALRDVLLPELLSGRLRVPDAREHVEAVV